MYYSADWSCDTECTEPEEVRSLYANELLFDLKLDEGIPEYG